MNKRIVAAIVGGIGLILVGFFSLKALNPKLQGSSITGRASYPVIGSETSGVITSTTLTSVYSGNTKTLVSTYLGTLNLQVRYQPKSAGAQIYIYVEGSNDDGVTYFPIGITDTLTNTSTIALYGNGASSTLGIPIVFPAVTTSASGSLYAASLNLPFVADHLRISAREETTSTAGFAFVRATMISQE